MAREKKELKPGASVFATGVYLELQKDKTWKVMSFEEDTFHDGLSVDNISAVPSENNPSIGGEEEE